MKLVLALVYALLSVSTAWAANPYPLYGSGSIVQGDLIMGGAVSSGGLAGPVVDSGIPYNSIAGISIGAPTSTGSANVQNVLALAVKVYTQGLQIPFIAGFTNTSAATLTVTPNGAALPVYVDTSSGPIALTGGEIVATNAYVVLYDLALNSGAGGWHLHAVTAPVLTSSGSPQKETADFNTQPFQTNYYIYASSNPVTATLPLIPTLWETHLFKDAMTGCQTRTNAMRKKTAA